MLDYLAQNGILFLRRTFFVAANYVRKRNIVPIERLIYYNFYTIFSDYNLSYYIHVTIDKALCFDSKVLIQLNYKGITTVYIWRIGYTKLKQLQLKSN